VKIATKWVAAPADSELQGAWLCILPALAICRRHRGLSHFAIAAFPWVAFSMVGHYPKARDTRHMGHYQTIYFVFNEKQIAWQFARSSKFN
jgi:hypothetical protein